ncbi:hypothetical protein HDU88_000308 [Geranomyces variabilis]|nr:hypothetical protein HDU88_000308 [Geranomyces variabilis]
MPTPASSPSSSTSDSSRPGSPTPAPHQGLLPHDQGLLRTRVKDFLKENSAGATWDAFKEAQEQALAKLPKAGRTHAQQKEAERLETLLRSVRKTTAHIATNVFGAGQKRPKTPDAAESLAKRPATEDAKRSDHTPQISVRSSGSARLVAELLRLHAKKAECLLHWGILSTSDADQFQLLSTELAQSVIDQANQIGQAASIASPVTHLLEYGHPLSIKETVDGIWRHGASALWKATGGADDLANTICEDPDVRYIQECFIAMQHYVANYAATELGERSFDWHAVHAFACVPFRNVGPSLFYGETMSEADQSEKHARLNDQKRKGKVVDFLYKIVGHEHGVAESSGPATRAHYDHVQENRVHLARTARTQWLWLNNVAPQAAAQIAVPYFQIYGNVAEFSVLYRFEPELFATHQFAEVEFPVTDNDSAAIFGMCTAFLTMRNIMERSVQAMKRQPSKPGFRPAIMPGLRKELLTKVNTPKKDKDKKAHKGKKPSLDE